MTHAPLSRRRKLAIVAGLVLLALCGGAALLLRRGPAPFAFRFPAGNVYTYRLELDVRGAATAATGVTPREDALSAELALEGELELRSYGRLDDGGDTLLGA